MPAQDEMQAVERHKDNRKRLQQAIKQMERQVRKNPDGSFELKAKNAQEAGIDAEAFEQLRQSLEIGNQHVKAGKVRGVDVLDRTGEPEEDEKHAKKVAARG